MKHRIEAQREVPFPALSKRGARRVIQRAFVLVGRQRAIRQHLREADLTTLWVLADWGLEWTVILDHGRLEFHRGRTGKPRVTLAWQSAAGFFEQLQAGNPFEEEDFEFIGDAPLRRVVEPVGAAFSSSLREVLRNPVDDDGEPLL